MFCPKCGTQNPDGAKFCGGCGAAINAPAQAQYPPQQVAQPATQQAAIPAQPRSAQAQPAQAFQAQAAAGAAGAAVKRGKPMSRRTMLIGAGVGVVALAGIAFGVTRCTGLGGASGVVPVNSKDKYLPVAFSDAINNGRTIWYKTSGSIGRDSAISAAYVFENGKVTYYVPDKYEAGADTTKEYKVTFEDLKDLSDDDIIGKLKGWDEAYFNRMKQNAITALDDAKQALQDEWSTYSQETSEFLSRAASELRGGLDSLYGDYSVSLDELSGKVDTVIAFVDERKSKYEALTYQAPEAADWRLQVITDSTGNATSSEHLIFEYPQVDWAALDSNDGDMVAYYVDEFTRGLYAGSVDGSLFYEGAATADVSGSIDMLLDGETPYPEPGYATAARSFSVTSEAVSSTAIYDKYYSGMKGLWCRSEEEAMGVTLDDPSDGDVEVVQSFDD